MEVKAFLLVGFERGKAATVAFPEEEAGTGISLFGVMEQDDSHVEGKLFL